MRSSFCFFWPQKKNVIKFDFTNFYSVIILWRKVNNFKIKECESNGGNCVVEIDGYYIESVICVIFGFMYLILWGWNVVKTLQNADENQWRVVQTNKSRWCYSILVIMIFVIFFYFLQSFNKIWNTYYKRCVS